jgi:hypothetical protein
MEKFIFLKAMLAYYGSSNSNSNKLKLKLRQRLD